MTTVCVCFASRVKNAARLAHLRDAAGHALDAAEFHHLDRIEHHHAAAGVARSARRPPRRASRTQRCSRSSGNSSRRARIASCCSDSSPDTYSTSELASELAITCSSSVLFPAPGIAADQHDRPGTSPPPSTRSNSANRLRCAALGESTSARICTPARRRHSPRGLRHHAPRRPQARTRRIAKACSTRRNRGIDLPTCSAPNRSPGRRKSLWTLPCAVRTVPNPDQASSASRRAVGPLLARRCSDSMPY